MTIGPVEQKKKTVVEPNTGNTTIKVEPPQDVYEKEKKIVREKQNIWYVWIVIQTIQAFRFILLILGADLTTSLFGIIVNLLSLPFIILFSDLFPTTRIPPSSIMIEWSTLFAMIVYTAVIWLVSVFLKLKKPMDPRDVEEKIERGDGGII